MSAVEIVKLAAIVALVVWCFWWIIRDDQATKREQAARVPGSDTPIFDDLAAERLHEDLETWGRP